MTAFLVFVLSVLAFAQTDDTVVSIKATGPPGTADAKISYKKSLVAFALGNCTADGVGACALPLSIASRTGYLPAALQFDLQYGADIVGIAVSIGPAAAAAQKTVQCGPIAGGTRCVISGMNQTAILDGVVAIVTVETQTSSQASSTVALLGTVSASAAAKQIPTVIAPGGGVITMPPLLASVTCAQPDIWTDQAVACTANLNKPTAVAVTLALLSSDASLVVVPESVTIAAGATSGAFTVTGK